MAQHDVLMFGQDGCEPIGTPLRYDNGDDRIARRRMSHTYNPDQNQYSGGSFPNLPRATAKHLPELPEPPHACLPLYHPRALRGTAFFGPLGNCQSQ